MGQSRLSFVLWLLLQVLSQMPQLQSCLERVWQPMKAADPEQEVQHEPSIGQAYTAELVFISLEKKPFPFMKAVSAVPGWVGKADRNMLCTELCSVNASCFSVFPLFSPLKQRLLPPCIRGEEQADNSLQPHLMVPFGCGIIFLAARYWVMEMRCLCRACRAELSLDASLILFTAWLRHTAASPSISVASPLWG